MKTLAERIDVNAHNIFVSDFDKTLRNVTTIAAEHDTVMAQMAEALEQLMAVVRKESPHLLEDQGGDILAGEVCRALSAYQSLGEQS